MEISERVLGLLLAILSANLYTAMYSLIQYASLSPFDFHLSRSILMVLIFFMPKLCRPDPILPKDKKVKRLTPLEGRVIIRVFSFQGLSVFAAALMSISTLGASFCVLVLPVGDAGTITHSCLLFTVVLARLLVGTPISMWKLFWTVVLCVGLSLVVKPTMLFGEVAGEGGKQSLFAGGKNKLSK